MKKPFQNLVVDHMTLLLEPRYYPVAYALFRIVFGVDEAGIIYEKRKRWPGESEERSMTFAVKIGENSSPRKTLGQSIFAVVQPSEPDSQSSHVRSMLESRGGSAHWQHVALRTSDLLAFHKHALDRGVNFITPILKDDDEDLIQVFSGEWIMPGRKPSALFFEFVQRNPGRALLRKIASGNRQAWFRDRTFLGLYQEKENEYRSGKVTPFIDDELFAAIEKRLSGKPLWEIKAADLRDVEKLMKDYAASKKSRSAPALAA
jgi:hypothetical protein